MLAFGTLRCRAAALASLLLSGTRWGSKTCCRWWRGSTRTSSRLVDRSGRGRPFGPDASSVEVRLPFLPFPFAFVDPFSLAGGLTRLPLPVPLAALSLAGGLLHLPDPFSLVEGLATPFPLAGLPFFPAPLSLLPGSCWACHHLCRIPWILSGSRLCSSLLVGRYPCQLTSETAQVSWGSGGHILLRRLLSTHWIEVPGSTSGQPVVGHPNPVRIRGRVCREAAEWLHQPLKAWIWGILSRKAAATS